MAERQRLGLDALATIMTGATPPASQPDSWGDDVDFITPSDQYDGQRTASPSRRLSQIGAERLKKRLVPSQSTNLTCIGSTIGKVTMAAAPSITNQQINTLVAKPGIADPVFLYYMVKNWSGSLKGHASGSATPIVNKSVLAGYEFEVPGLPEQRAIAEVLGALDDKIAANTKLAETVEQLGGARLSALGINEEPGADAVALDTYFEFNPRRAKESAEAVLIDMQALPTSQPLISRWSTGPKRGGARFMNGDTLLARITPCLENRKTGFVDFLDDGEVGIGSTEFIVIRSRNEIPLGVSYFFATSDRFRDFAIQNMVGTSGRQRVSAADIARFELNPIATSELVAFGEWADSALKILGSLRDENKYLAATRDTLLPQLMSGKLRVKDIENIMGEMV